MNKLTFLVVAFPLLFVGHGWAQTMESDVCVYGGTASGVIAAVQSARLGKSVVIIEPGSHLGGMTSGGLGNTDVGKPHTIGGTTREFYTRIIEWYKNADAWRYYKSTPSPEELMKDGKNKRIADDAMFVFEPHVAESILNAMIEEENVRVVFGERLDLKSGVEKDGNKITSIRMESGKTFRAKVFLDCSYEGDLMAKAGVDYTIGREANAQYDETYNGVQIHKEKRGGKGGLDPYVIPGDPNSGLIVGLQADVEGKQGDADNRVQAYNYRLCLTSEPENRVLFDKPADYDEKDFELLFRWFESGGTSNLPLSMSGLVPNSKRDVNKAGWVSTDYIGHADAYPDADHALRDQIVKDHIRYTKGLLWTLANHPRVPSNVRSKASRLGHAKDEFADTGHFPHQLYVREGRRMVGEFVMTEHEALGRRKVGNPIALGSYGMDSHPTQIWVDAEGYLRADTPIWKGVRKEGYGISYHALTPKADQCSNLLVPVCVSASHSVYGSLRMEPVYMMMGQAAGTAATLAIDDSVAVQEVPYDKLREQLLKDEQRLAH